VNSIGIGILGASGDIGQHIAEALLRTPVDPERATEFRLAARRPEAIQAPVGASKAASRARITTCACDVRDQDSLARLADGGAHLGYLLKDRVADIDTFLEAADRVAEGGLVLDPEVVAQVLGRGRKADPVAQLSPREREVLGLMAEGHTNAGIAKRLVVTEGAIEKHTQRIFSKLGLHPDPGVHRRVKAVLTLLSS